MPETAAGRILIDGLDNPGIFEDAQSAALKLESHIAKDPKLVADVLAQTEPILRQPHFSAEELDRTSSDRHRVEIAHTIADLLAHTADGRHLAYDDQSYLAIDNDERHRQLVEAFHKHDQHKAGTLGVDRRRVALSGLAIFVRLQNQQQQSQPTSTSEVA